MIDYGLCVTPQVRFSWTHIRAFHGYDRAWFLRDVSTAAFMGSQLCERCRGLAHRVMELAPLYSMLPECVLQSPRNKQNTLTQHPQ